MSNRMAIWARPRLDSHQPMLGGHARTLPPLYPQAPPPSRATAFRCRSEVFHQIVDRSRIGL